MKKLTALVLALLLALSLGSVAFAATTRDASVWSEGFVYEHAYSTTMEIRPGENIQMHVYGIYGYLYEMENLNTKDWKVEAEWTKGGALVDSVTINKDDNTIDLKLKENFTISEGKSLEGKITLTARRDFTLTLRDPIGGVATQTENIVKGDKYVVVFDYNDVQNKAWATVTNNVITVYGEEDPDDCVAEEALDNTIYVCDEDTPGYVKFNDKALLGCLLNMAGKEKAFMYTDESAIEALTEKYPDAAIECYNFGGQPTFKNAAKFTLQADYADQYYIYSYKSGKLAALEAEWDSDEGVYTWETKSPTSYVISDVELVAAAETDATAAEVKNPDTGANDVVGIAAGLAVVSLVAAAAVSLKK